MKKTLQLIFDGDIILWEATLLNEEEFLYEDDTFILYSSFKKVKTFFDERIQSLIDKVLHQYNQAAEFEIVICFTDPHDNFRKKVYPEYKSNRVEIRKPLGYAQTRSWIISTYKCFIKKGLEADDCCGILATLNPQNSILISKDKDFKSIPCLFFNMNSKELKTITQEEADFNFFKQCLTGDAIDGYKGCSGIGEVSATNLLNTKGASWQTVLDAYLKKGYKEEDALTQARVARILRKEDYNFKKNEVKLWTP